MKKLEKLTDGRLYYNGSAIAIEGYVADADFENWHIISQEEADEIRNNQIQESISADAEGSNDFDNDLEER